MAMFGKKARTDKTKSRRSKKGSLQSKTERNEPLESTQPCTDWSLFFSNSQKSLLCGTEVTVDASTSHFNRKTNKLKNRLRIFWNCFESNDSWQTAVGPMLKLQETFSFFYFNMLWRVPVHKLGVRSSNEFKLSTKWLQSWFKSPLTDNPDVISSQLELGLTEGFFSPEGFLRGE